MKKSKIIAIAIALAAILIQSCTKAPIEGLGNMVSVSLPVEDFSGIYLTGRSDVYIAYGETQEVKVVGHSNIIHRIETDVINGVWFMMLEEGSYSHYELTFYLTLPAIDKVSSTGTGNIYITQFNEQTKLNIELLGEGSFIGLPVKVEECQVRIEGSGECEVNVDQALDAHISGSGRIYYKGSPEISSSIEVPGTLISLN